MKKEDIKILLVDDEPDILEIIRFNLEKVGYQIKTASNGLDAIKVSKKFLPHLIILDVMMPDLDGMETCERLRRAIPRNNHHVFNCEGRRLFLCSCI